MATTRPAITDPLIIDASVAASWLLDDEDEPYADAVFARLRVVGGLVPQFWEIEIRNVLLYSERRNRITPAAVERGLADLAALPIDTDDSLDLDVTYDLARTHRLTFYDAIYLELALRRNVVLATLDKELANAAATESLLMTTN